jgi:hypothetical protein
VNDAHASANGQLSKVGGEGQLDAEWEVAYVVKYAGWEDVLGVVTVVDVDSLAQGICESWWIVWVQRLGETVAVVNTTSVPDAGIK